MWLSFDASDERVDIFKAVAVEMGPVTSFLFKKGHCICTVIYAKFQITCLFEKLIVRGKFFVRNFTAMEVEMGTQ